MKETVQEEVFNALKLRQRASSRVISEVLGLNPDQVRHAMWGLKNNGCVKTVGKHPFKEWEPIEGAIPPTDGRGKNQASLIGRQLGQKEMTRLIRIGRETVTHEELDKIQPRERLTYLYSRGKEAEARGVRVPDNETTLLTVMRSTLLGGQKLLRIVRANRVKWLRDAQGWKTAAKRDRIKTVPQPHPKPA